MKKNILIASLIMGSCLLSGCGNTTPSSGSQPPEDSTPTISTPAPVEKTLSVKEVLEQPDLTKVTFEGIVIGYDFGKRHIIIEDIDQSCSIQLYKNPGYAKVKTGDKVKVVGYRTFDRSVDRISPDSLEIISSNNPCSLDHPTVIEAEDLMKWTSENRTNKDILFKAYEFKNVEIAEFASNYTYLDNKYDEEGGRGLKIGIKNDSSFFPVDELKLVQGQKYNIKAVLYGISDDFFDESLDGTVLRLSILKQEDVELIIQNTEQATVVVSGKRSFLTSETTLPDFKTYFNVIDPVDGEVTVTDEMITNNIDLKTPGTYKVTFEYTNSVKTKTVKEVEIYVTEKGNSISEALTHVEEGIDMYVNGVVLGWSFGGGQKKAMIVQDPTTGEAIEFWVNKKNEFQKMNVGDQVLLYSTNLAYEKGLPRLGGTVSLLETISTGNELYPATEIADLSAWSASLVESKASFFGRYTFTAEFVEQTDKYAYFLKEGAEGNHILQIGLYESTISYNFTVGEKYKVTAVAHGISDAYSALETKSIVMRLSIMNESDVEHIVEKPVEGEDATVNFSGEKYYLIGDEKPDFTSAFTVVDAVDGAVTVTPEMITNSMDMSVEGDYEITLTYTNTNGYTTTYKTSVNVSQYGLSVSQAIALKGTNTPVYFHGYVSGFAKNSSNNKTAVTIEDTENGETIEFWANDHKNYLEEFNKYNVGDHVVIKTDCIKDNKGLPRAGNTKNATMPIKVISSNNTLKEPTVIEDLGAFIEAAKANKTNVLGRYKYTGVASGASNLLVENSTYKFQLNNSYIAYTFEENATYEITFVIHGYSKALEEDPAASVRFTIMNENDVKKIA